jgi:glycosyltransferase involved in cell wall biosynthesis
VTLVTDIVTPYGVPVLEALAERVALTVVFCSASGTRGGDWRMETPRFHHRVAGGAAMRRRSRIDTDIYPSPRVMREIAASRPAAIVSGGWSFPTLYAVLYGAVARVPVIVQSDGTPHSERHLNRLQSIARRLLVPAASAFVANSDASRRRFMDLGADPERVFVAPHTTDIARFWAAADARRARRDATLPRSDESVTVLSVGRLLPSKGVHLLLRAVAAGSRRGAPPIRVSLVGGGPEEHRLGRLARELGVDLTIRGFVDQRALPEIYGAADVFAFPTLDDTFGIVLLEAAASGLPLVASPYAGATEDLVGPDTGRVVDPHHTERLAAVLRELADNPALRAEMGRRAHVRTLSRTPERAAEAYVEAVAAVLGSRTSTPSDSG